MSLGIQDIYQIGQPLVGFMYEIQMPVVLPSGDSGTFLRARAYSVKIPGASSRPVPIAVQGIIAKYAGMIDFTRELPVLFYEDTSMRVWESLRNWQILQGTPDTGSASPASVYRASIYVNSIDVTKTIVNTFQFVSAWPQQIADTDMGGEDNRAVGIQVIFSYDYILKTL